MSSGATISFRGLEPSPLLRDLIGRRVEGLDRFDMGLEHSVVTVELLARHRGRTQAVRVHIRLEMPGRSLSFGRESAGGPVNRDMRLAVMRCFDSAEYELGYLSARRASAGARLLRLHLGGRVSDLNPWGGVVHGDDGQDYSFAVADAELSVGMSVTFQPREGPDGASAWRVRPVPSARPGSPLS